MADHLTRRGFSADDALMFISKMLKDTPGVVEHTFRSRPDPRQDLIAASTLESTTLPLWLVPRLLTAAAVLQYRCSDVDLTATTETIRSMSHLSDAMVQVALDLVLSSLRAPSQGANIRLLLLECLEASLRAISYAGCPSFLPHSTPPISLLPKKGECHKLVSYFPPTKAQEYQPSQRRYGEGINRLVSIDRRPWFLCFRRAHR